MFSEIDPIIKQIIQNIKDASNLWEFDGSCYSNKTHKINIDTINDRKKFYYLAIRNKVIFSGSNSLNNKSQNALMNIIHKTEKEKTKLDYNKLINSIPTKETHPEEFI
ncbi:MAG: hypothetical protein BV456_04035 [Thermoplasmata archaeon M8B2D]|nr:MAG: hypothetical protein BV456_04035 [Thermoplasmata archaeon M8B2D]